MYQRLELGNNRIHQYIVMESTNEKNLSASGDGINQSEECVSV